MNDKPKKFDNSNTSEAAQKLAKETLMVRNKGNGEIELVDKTQAKEMNLDNATINGRPAKEVWEENKVNKALENAVMSDGRTGKEIAETSKRNDGKVDLSEVKNLPEDLKGKGKLRETDLSEVKNLPEDLKGKGKSEKIDLSNILVQKGKDGR